MSIFSVLVKSCRQVSRNASALRLATPSSQVPLTSIAFRGHHGHGQTVTDSAGLTDNKFYELRTYKIKPDRFQEFLGLTKEHMDLRMSHSKLVGYWVTDIGGINEVFHIWEYECFAARSAIRAALAQDETWNALYFSKALKMFASQENLAAKLLPWKPLQDTPFKEGGTYELRQYVLKHGSVNAMKAPLMVRDEAYSNMGCGKLIGAWLGDIGHCNTIYMLWNFVNADKRAEARQKVLETEAFKALPPNPAKTPDCRSKIMVPLPFSPLN